MKKVSLFLVAVVLFTSCKKDTKPVQAVINFMSGGVFIVKGDTRIPAKIEDTISQGDTIETDEKSFVDIVFGANIVKIMENSAVEIKQLIQNLGTNGEQTEFFVKNGKLISRITKKLGKDDSYKVATPTSLAAVRGTDFIVSEENGKSYIACTDGKVFIVKNSDKSSVDIDAGQEVYVEPDKRLTVKDLSEENRRGIENILDEISKIQEDIRKRFDEERERIRDDVRTMKDENKEKVDEQRKTDKQNVSNQKAADKANRDAIAGAVKDGSDEAKKAIEDVKPDINSVKPQIKKPQVKPSGE